MAKEAQVSALTKGCRVAVEEFEQAPEIDGIQELLDGEIVEIPPPKLRHNVLVRCCERALRRYFDEARVWMETGFLIGESCVQPDVAVIHPEQGVDRGWYSGAPLIAVEVTPRGNTSDELEFK